MKTIKNLLFALVLTVCYSTTSKAQRLAVGIDVVKYSNETNDIIEVEYLNSFVKWSATLDNSIVRMAEYDEDANIIKTVEMNVEYYRVLDEWYQYVMDDGLTLAFAKDGTTVFYVFDNITVGFSGEIDY